MAEIGETADGEDVEFQIRLLQVSPYAEGLKSVRRFFEDNEEYTDVLFYGYPNHVYKVIVRKDYYTDFVVQLLKVRLLKSVEWTD